MKKNIFSAVFIISVFTVADRALGFVFKIFLSRELGAEALGVYQVALSLFFVLLTATTSGIPLIVSKLTAKYRIEGEIKRERALTTAALVVGLVISVVISAVTLLLHKPLGKLFTDAESASVLLYLLPALIFSSVYSALRGNLWGRQRYFAVSIVENLEQIARILVCVLLFALGLNKLRMTALSLSVGCFVSMIAVIFCFVSAKGRLASPKGEIVPLLRSSTPITVSRAAASVVSSVLSIAVPFLLIASGYTKSEAMALYGASIGMALPLLYIPITVVGSLAFVMIPTVSRGISEGKTQAVNSQITSAIGFSIIVAALFVPMFAVLGVPIGEFVYDNAPSGKFISVSAWLLIPLSVENITSSVMNSLDLELKSFFNYLIGSAATFAILFAYYGNFTIEILSFALGAGWTLTTALHLLSIRKKTGLGFSYIGKLVKSVVLIFPSGFLTKCCYSLTIGIGRFGALAISATAGMLFFAAVGYALGLIDINFFSSAVKVQSKKRKLHSKTLAKTQ